MNEKLAPEILYYQQDVLDEARAAVDAQVTVMHMCTTLCNAVISVPPRVDHAQPPFAAIKHAFALPAAPAVTTMCWAGCLHPAATCTRP
jgi:hypothetical protein